MQTTALRLSIAAAAISILGMTIRPALAENGAAFTTRGVTDFALTAGAPSRRQPGSSSTSTPVRSVPQVANNTRLIVREQLYPVPVRRYYVVRRSYAVRRYYPIRRYYAVRRHYLVQRYYAVRRYYLIRRHYAAWRYYTAGRYYLVQR
jgi:hypothetical protein